MQRYGLCRQQETCFPSERSKSLPFRAPAAAQPPFPCFLLPPVSNTMAPPRRSPEHEFKSAPPPAAASAGEQESQSRIIDNLSPPLIAMFAVIGIAFVIVVYARLLSRQIRRLRRRWRRWRRCRHLLRSAAIESQFSPPPPYAAAPFPFSSDSYSDHVLSPYGLDDAAIKTLPLSIFSKSKAKQPASTNRDCAVCLFEFEDGEWLRTLPICSHAFHIECIDVWLRSHPTCPLCRAAISFRSESPFIPMRAARIRPSFDDIVLDHPAAIDPASPISEERGRGFPLKRSYSFGFERSVGAERMVMEITAAATVSPAWGLRHQQHQSNHHQHRGFWSKRWASPFGSGGGSARPYYNRRSPFVRRWGFVPLSAGGGGAVGSSTAAIGGRRSRSMTSPSAMGMGMGRALGFSSSRMRCGDPEALISPERFNRR